MENMPEEIRQTRKKKKRVRKGRLYFLVFFSACHYWWCRVWNKDVTR